MSILQTTSYQPSLCVRNTSQSLHLSSKPYILPVHAKLPLQNPSLAIRNASNQQQCMPILKNQKCRAASTYQHSSLVCLLGGKGKHGSDNEGSPWKALENAMGNLKKESSIEDVLRKQIEKKEFYKDKDSATRGGGRGRGGGGGAGGRGGGGAEGSSGSDEGFAGIIDETFQVILATIGFIFLYVYIISGEEWARLAKDYLKFLFKGSESARLKRAMDKWGRFYQKLTEKLYDQVGEGHTQYPNLVG
ncbi:hypothetical protein RchiOBHm_Chr2g0115921 [Rosa chinensis]|uniref:Uncharacterized protein n=1 Tax=Rosa chinensis TaxID=74649 RepID=A0A2P6RR51_ROSCH|nr:hypothetical protein RchiOBHm_Chr2g0115921 [Rosa chinensis]